MALYRFNNTSGRKAKNNLAFRSQLGNKAVLVMYECIYLFVFHIFLPCVIFSLVLSIFSVSRHVFQTFFFLLFNCSFKLLLSFCTLFVLLQCSFFSNQSFNNISFEPLFFLISFLLSFHTCIYYFSSGFLKQLFPNSFFSFSFFN